jgi:hypothetical protein
VIIEGIAAGAKPQSTARVPTNEHNMGGASSYSSEFFEVNRESGERSAKVIVPIVLDALSHKLQVELSSLRRFRDMGVRTLLSLVPTVIGNTLRRRTGIGHNTVR